MFKFLVKLATFIGMVGALAQLAIIRGGHVIEGSASDVYSKSLGSPALGTVAAVHAAVTDNGAQQVVTTAITQPPTPRTITATAGGVGADIGAISVTIAGTNEFDEAITEVLPAFTVNTPGTVEGAKVFKTITSITIPAHDGVGATTSVGLGAGLGLGVCYSRDTVVNAYLGGVREATRPTVTFSPTAVESNKVTLNSALNGTAVIVDTYDTY